MPLFNSEINLILTWSANCVITDSVGVGTFSLTDTKLYVLVVTLLTEDNSILPKQINLGFKHTVS